MSITNPAARNHIHAKSTSSTATSKSRGYSIPCRSQRKGALMRGAHQADSIGLGGKRQKPARNAKKRRFMTGIATVSGTGAVRPDSGQLRAMSLEALSQSTSQEEMSVIAPLARQHRRRRRTPQSLQGKQSSGRRVESPLRLLRKIGPRNKARGSPALHSAARYRNGARKPGSRPGRGHSVLQNLSSPLVQTRSARPSGEEPDPVKARQARRQRSGKGASKISLQPIIALSHPAEARNGKPQGSLEPHRNQA